MGPASIAAANVANLRRGVGPAIVIVHPMFQFQGEFILFRRGAITRNTFARERINSSENRRIASRWNTTDRNDEMGSYRDREILSSRI